MVCHATGTVAPGVLTVGMVCLMVAPWSFAQSAQPERLVDYVSPSRLALDASANSSTLTSATDTTSLATPSWSEDAKAKAKSSGDRLVSFEQEYGMALENRSTIGKVIQAAKYGLDKMCFTVQEAAKKLEFQYNTSEATSGVLGGDAGQPQYNLPVIGKFSHAQVETVVTVHDPQTGQTFFGVKLSLPFGPGGPQYPETSRQRTPAS